VGCCIAANDILLRGNKFFVVPGGVVPTRSGSRFDLPARGEVNRRHLAQWYRYQ